MHHHREDVRRLAKQAIEWCGESIAACLPVDDAALIGRPDLGLDEADFGPDLDLCLSLGGDGTMLRTCHLVSGHDVSILGINGGRLGYLTQFDREQMIGALDLWRQGRLTTERRMMLGVSVDTGATGEGPERFLGYALNEAVISRAISGHAVEVGVTISGRPFGSYLADGLMVATPTGSTAYSLSAGGPIVDPDLDALLLTPVAAHMVFNRSMVMAPSVDLRLTVEGYRPGLLSVDGRNLVEVSPGHTIICRRADRTARFLVEGDRDFHTVLREKFKLVDDEC